MTPTDAAFLKAITTIKTISRGPNALAKPPPKRKVHLYGLYKQATEGDVEGIMPRPEGDDLQTKANQLKWDAWRQQHGKTKQEAKLLYVGYLLETMRVLAPSSDPVDLPPQWLELEEAYQIAKKAAIEAGGAYSQTPYAHGRRLSVGSINSSYSHFLQANPVPSSSIHGATFSEFGLSEKDRSDLQADRLVNRLQSVYPPVLPGAVPLSYDKDEWSGRHRITGNDYSSVTAPDESDAPPRSHWLKSASWEAYCWLFSTAESLLKRIVIDSLAVISVLILLRIVSSRRDILERSPVLRRTVKTLFKISVVILDGFGVELRLKHHNRTLNRALHT